MHEELGRLWNDNLQQPKKAQENLRRAIELGDPVRQIADPARRGRRRTARTADLASATLALAPRARARPAGRRAPAGVRGAHRRARRRLASPCPPRSGPSGAGLLAALAEMYDGEHGLAYSAGALDIEPGHDRAVQLYAFYAHALAREDDVGVRYLAYIEANPSGAMAGEARWLLAASYEAAGQADNAIQILEPLRAVGDPEATAKLGELYAQVGRAMPTRSAGRARRLPGDAASARRGPASVEKVESALDAAQAFATAGKRPEAYKKYREVLAADPVHPEALSWVQDYLRTKRDYAPAPRRAPRGGPRCRASRSRRAEIGCARWRGSARATSATSTARSRRGSSSSPSTGPTRPRASR